MCNTIDPDVALKAPRKPTRFIPSLEWHYDQYLLWLVVEPYPSEKYEFVSLDDEIPNWMESHKIPWFHYWLYPIISH